MSDPMAESPSESTADTVVDFLSAAWRQDSELPIQNVQEESQHSDTTIETEPAEVKMTNSVDLLIVSNTHSGYNQNEGEVMSVKKIISDKCLDSQISAVEQEVSEECPGLKENGECGVVTENGITSHTTNVSKDTGNDSMHLLLELDGEDSSVNTDTAFIKNDSENKNRTEEVLQKEVILGTAEGIDPFSPNVGSQSHCNGGDIPKCEPSPVGTDTTDSDVVDGPVIEPSTSSCPLTPMSSSPTAKASSAPSSRRSSGRSTHSAKEEASRRGSRTLGDTKGVYRLSMKLSPNLFNMEDIPGVGQHRDVVKAGFLNKLSGRSFPYIPQWKKRYCVLSKGKLFYYERSDSRAGEKGAGVINLEYFDQVSEAGPKDCKKATNVFIITSQDKSFFDPGRHMFSADTLPDMKDWMRKLQSSLEHIRNNNRTGFTTAPGTPKPTKDVSTGGSTERRKKNNTDNQNSGTSSRERNKKEQDSSQRRKKPVATSVSSETQTHCEVNNTNMKATEEPVTQEGNQAPGPENDALPVDGPKLDFVQKRRVQGPRGRRNPKSIYQLSMNQRAISCSALEPGEQENNSSGTWQNRSVDIEDNQAHNSQPQLTAYHYSSDEDEDIQSQIDSIHRSASGLMPAPPPPPPRSASYSLELRNTHPQLFSQYRNGSLHSLRDERGSDVDSHSSQRSLVEVRDAFGGPGDWQPARKNSYSDSKGSINIAERSISMAVAPFGRRSGRASPAMDDLENLLMNQSVQQSATTDPLECTSSEVASSEGSTVHAVNTHQKQPSQVHPQAPPRQQPKSSPDLSRFSTAVRHLQRHVVDMDRAVHGLASDVAGARGDTAALKDSVSAVRNDADLLTVALAEISQEVTATRQQVISTTQKTEELQRKANSALIEAEKARQEQIKIKQEYESLVAEMKNHLKSLKEIDVQNGLETQKDAPKIKDAQQTNKDQSEKSRNLQSSNNHPQTKELKKDKHGNYVGEEITSKSQKDQKSPNDKHVKEDKKNKNGGKDSSDSPTVTPRTGYQSLFTRPSSLIAGLTNRHSLTKSVSFADQKSDTSESGKKSKDKINSLEKKSDSVDKIESKSQGSLERNSEEQGKKKKDINQNCSQEKNDSKPHKEEKKNSRLEETSNIIKSKEAPKIENGHSSPEMKKRSPNKHPEQNKNKLATKGSHHPNLNEAGRAISNLSLEDIPMADDTSYERHKASFYNQVHNTSVNTPSNNYNLFKSSSTPAVPNNSNVKKNYILPINSFPDFRNNPSSLLKSETTPNFMPSGPMASRPSSALDDSGMVSDSSFGNMYRPGATPGPLIRQTSMTTVPEDRVINDHTPTKAVYSKKPGVFAISRQNSSPSIPLSRGNSSGRAFPLVRQYSLGQVPEEGGMTRQDSVLSIEGNRCIVDQTLPLSPSASVTSLPISPSSSTNFLISPSSSFTVMGNPTVKQAKVRHSMELVTGPILSGSAKQESQSAMFTFPESISTNGLEPNATSSLKKNQKSFRTGREVIL